MVLVQLDEVDAVSRRHARFVKSHPPCILLLGPCNAGTVRSAMKPLCSTRVAPPLLRLARGALPQHCVLCAAACGNFLMCLECANDLPRIDAACPTCGLPSPRRAVCGTCLRSPPPQSCTVAAFVYTFPIDRLLHDLKYGGALALADWAAGALAQAVDVIGEAIRRPDVIVALPLSRERQRERGFNQTEEIARGVSRRLGIPRASLLERIRHGTPQAGLPWQRRQRNVQGAFRCRAEVPGRHVAIVDDVMTTGATVREAARTLRAGGAASVAAWVVARTPAPADAGLV